MSGHKLTLKRVFREIHRYLGLEELNHFWISVKKGNDVQGDIWDDWDLWLRLHGVDLLDHDAVRQAADEFLHTRMNGWAVPAEDDDDGSSENLVTTPG